MASLKYSAYNRLYVGKSRFMFTRKTVTSTRFSHLLPLASNTFRTLSNTFRHCASKSKAKKKKDEIAATQSPPSLPPPPPGSPAALKVPSRRNQMWSPLPPLQRTLLPVCLTTGKRKGPRLLAIPRTPPPEGGPELQRFNRDSPGPGWVNGAGHVSMEPVR